MPMQLVPLDAHTCVSAKKLGGVGAFALSGSRLVVFVLSPLFGRIDERVVVFRSFWLLDLSCSVFFPPPVSNKL